MRAILGTHAAMVTYQRQFCVLAKIYCANGARFQTAFAAYTGVFFYNYAATFPGHKRVGRANFGTGGLAAAMANRVYKLARNTAIGAYFYPAFCYRMAFGVNPCTHQHTRKTADTFGHTSRS